MHLFEQIAIARETNADNYAIALQTAAHCGLIPPASDSQRDVRLFNRELLAWLFLGDATSNWTHVAAYFCAIHNWWTFALDCVERDRCAFYLAVDAERATEFAEIISHPGRRVRTRRDLRDADERTITVGPRTSRILRSFQPGLGDLFDGAYQSLRQQTGAPRDLMVSLMDVDRCHQAAQATRTLALVNERLTALGQSLDALSVQLYENPAPAASASGEDCPVLASPSGRVKLFGDDQQPIVDGKRLPVLTAARYRVVRACLEAGGNGLTKDQLNNRCGGAADSHKHLADLEKLEGWKAVIVRPGRAHQGGYRIK
jgi:hypothetical protein